MDKYILEHIIADNPIQAELFLPFTINRLQQSMSTNQEVVLLVRLRDVGQIGESHQKLRLSWSANSMIEAKIPLQERVVTEWAAVGIACVLVPLYAGLRVLQVTQAGDGFDYWVGDDEREYALEVSGTLEENLESRHAAKVRQLQKNPYRVNGYVAVIRFASLETIFSFNSYQETTR